MTTKLKDNFLPIAYVLKYPLKFLKWAPYNKTNFVFLEKINRDTITPLKQKLRNSVIEFGVLTPIFVARMPWFNPARPNDLYILDGQNRYLVYCNLRADVPYIVLNISSKDEMVRFMATVNSSCKNWDLRNYVRAWSCVRPDLKKLMEYYEQTHIEMSVLAAVLGELNIPNGTGGCAAISKVIKDGSFKIVRERKNKDLINKMCEVKVLVGNGNRRQCTYLFKEYVSFFRNIGKAYVHSSFIKKLKASANKLDLAVHTDGKLVNIFN